MQAPEQIDPSGLDDHLEIISKAVFQSGMSWDVVKNKWPGMTEALGGWHADRIAALSEDEVAELTSDSRMIRSKGKISGTIHNAKALLRLEEDEVGGYEGWLSRLPGESDFGAAVKAFKKEFKWVGAFGLFYYLYVVKQPVISYETFRDEFA